MTAVWGVYMAWGLIGLFMSAIGIVCCHELNKRELAEMEADRALKLPQAPAVLYETYGHPWMPIPELKGVVPKPPVGFAWEITAVLNGRGNPALRLGLLDLGQGEVTLSAERDMVVIRSWQYAQDDTFAAFYRRAAQMHIDNINRGVNLGRQIFDTHLISPLRDWATAEVARRAVTSPPALSTSYALVESA